MLTISKLHYTNSSRNFAIVQELFIQLIAYTEFDDKLSPLF